MWIAYDYSSDEWLKNQFGSCKVTFNKRTAGRNEWNFRFCLTWINISISNFHNKMFDWCFFFQYGIWKISVELRKCFSVTFPVFQWLAGLSNLNHNFFYFHFICWVRKHFICHILRSFWCWNTNYSFKSRSKEQRTFSHRWFILRIERAIHSLHSFHFGMVSRKIVCIRIVYLF